jgi:hypothetical protein
MADNCHPFLASLRVSLLGFSSLTVNGREITNNGTINMLSTGSSTSLVITGQVALLGSGKIILSNNSQNLVTGSGTLTNFNTIEGTGNVGGGQLSIMNFGTISANGPAGSTLTLDAASFENECKCFGSDPNGILAVSHGDTLNITGNFGNFNSGTITGGIYNVAGTLEFAAGSTGIVSLAGATINLIGPTAKILNTSEGNSNALSGFDSGGLGLAGGAQFTTGGNFSNTGALTIGSGSKFSVGTNGAFDLANFSSSTSTLNYGAFILTGTGQVQFNNGGDSLDIVSSSGSITLAGSSTTRSLIDQNGNNALANFASNLQLGSFILTTVRTFTTGGSFSNAGIVNVQKASGTELIIGGGGSYSQTGGTTTLDGKLTASGGVNISGGHVYGNNGTFTGNFDFTGGTLNPGDGIDRVGVLNIAGNYTESGAAVLNIDLSFASPPTHDVLNISGTAILGGTLSIDSINNIFGPTLGQTLDILNYSSETGSFSTVNLPKAPTGDHWTFACGATDCTITLNSGPAPAKNGLVNNSLAACFSGRLLRAPAPCRSEPVATVGNMHAVASASAGLGTVHNNIMVATRAISTARGGGSHESSASAAAMARLYVCAYLPSNVAHTMGCN